MCKVKEGLLSGIQYSYVMVRHRIIGKMREITFVYLDRSAKAKCVMFVFLLQCFTMKALALCTIFSVLAIALSQPTYNLEQQELCDGVCQQDDLKTLQSQFKAQFTAIKNEISQLLQLKEEVNKVLQIYTGYSRNAVNATTLPGDYPTSPS